MNFEHIRFCPVLFDFKPVKILLQSFQLHSCAWVKSATVRNENIEKVSGNELAGECRTALSLSPGSSSVKRSVTRSSLLSTNARNVGHMKIERSGAEKSKTKKKDISPRRGQTTHQKLTEHVNTTRRGAVIRGELLSPRSVDMHGSQPTFTKKTIVLI